MLTYRKQLLGTSNNTDSVNFFTRQRLVISATPESLTMLAPVDVVSVHTRELFVFLHSARLNYPAHIALVPHGFKLTGTP